PPGPMDSASGVLAPSEDRYQPSELYSVLLHVNTCSPSPIAESGRYQKDSVRSSGWSSAAVPRLTAEEPSRDRACPAMPSVYWAVPLCMEMGWARGLVSVRLPAKLSARTLASSMVGSCA